VFVVCTVQCWVGVQGMDERNERLVFDRIVRSCCACACNPRKKSSRSGRDGAAASSSSALSAVENGSPR
jgi:hypothetical protein